MLEVKDTFAEYDTWEDRERELKLEEIKCTVCPFKITEDKLYQEAKKKAFKEVKDKIEQFKAAAIKRYGTDIVEGHSDALAELEHWISEQ